MSQAESEPASTGGRAPEAIALFNVALTSELFVNACWHKQQHGVRGLSWPAAFVLLPLTLHPLTRATLPTKSTVSLAGWAVRHPDLIADMDHRVATMVTPTKRAIRHGIRAGRLRLDGTDLVATARPRNPTKVWPAELTEAVRAARICGRWFNVIEVQSAFELLGIGS